MSFIPTIILFYIVSFTKIKCPKPISFTIKIKHINNILIPLFQSKIGNTTIDTVYSGLHSNSELFYAFTPKENCITLNNTMNGQCYYGDEKKKLNQSQTISFFGVKKNGPLYKENITIGDTNFELEFVYVEILGIYNGYINFGSKSLQYLKKKGIIKSSNIHYGPYNENKGSINVTVGGDYSLNNKKYFDECDIVENISGCSLKKIGIFYNNTKDNNTKTFDINEKAEFFSSDLFQNNETVVTGKNEAINKIITKLKENNFNCTTNEGIIQCHTPNKTLFLYFGGKGIKVNKIRFYEKNHSHLVFGFNTFKNMNIVIDYDKNKVFFYSGDNENPSNTNKKSQPSKQPFYKNKIFIIIAIFVVALIIAIILFYFLFHKKEQGNFGVSGAETLLEN